MTIRHLVKLLKRFFQTRQYRQTDSEVTLVGPRYGLGRQQWILPRSVCLFRTIRIDGIPSSDLQNVIELKILEWSPYQETGKYLARMGKYILVWIWDQEKHARKAEEHNAQKIPVFPETVMTKPEPGNTAGLYTCLAGYEARIWEQGILTAAHWWPERPTREQWSLFALRNDISPADFPRSSVVADFLVKPWGAGYGSRLVFNLQAHEYTIVRFLALILALYLFSLGSIALKTRREIAAVTEDVAIRERQVTPILNDRSEAWEYLEKVKQLYAVVPFPSQLQVMDEVIRIIPGAEIRKWEYRKGELTVLLTGKGLDPRVIIEQLDSVRMFSRITAQRGKKKGQFEIHLLVRHRMQG